jgi:WD40 repeat protein
MSRQRAAWLCYCAAVLGMFWMEGASALSEPATQPILRVETGMHTSVIRRVIPDLPRNRLITCSDDKTIRVWQMPEMRLVSVLRVPIDASHEGQLFAIAVSPDGKTVAAGGWTGWDWEGAASIYFFDTATGELLRRVNGFSNVVNALAWTPDGKDLAIGLQGKAGLTVMQLESGKRIASDIQYGDDIMDMDISPQGRIVATAFDGYVRLYDQNFKLVGRRMIPGGKKPVSVRFSPDGARIAVGFLDAPAVSVISARDMGLLFRPNLTGISGQVNFNSVVWSSDGTALYAAGDFRGNGLTPIYRWRESGHAVAEAIPIAQSRIPEIQQMPGNRVAFSSEDPGVGVLGPDGKVALYRGPDIANFSKLGEGLLLSADGMTVQYRLGIGENLPRTFSALRGGDQDTSAAVDESLAPPIRHASGIDLQGWQHGYAPTLNGRPVRLEDYEISRCYTIAPDSSSVLLGTEWSVRLLKPDATEIWSVSLPAVAWSVNISQNGQLAIAALSDGTIRWYRMRDGLEVLAYFPHNNGKDWIAWIPDGYYMSSIYGDNYVGWHLNRGKDLTPDFYRAVQFDRILYRPDVVTASFQAALAPNTRGIGPVVTGADFHIDKLREIAPPRLKVSAVAVNVADPAQPKATLRLEAERDALDIHDYTVFVNGIPVTPGKERKVAGKEATGFSRAIQINLFAKTNEIRVESFNGVSMGVAETFIALPSGAKPAQPKGDLYLLSVGANIFPNLPKRMHLAYAARDATELGKVLEARGLGNFQKVHTHILSDTAEIKPERELILTALKFVEQAGPDDAVVIFLASHGLSDAAGNYYFVPRDVVAQDIANAQKGGKVSSLIPWTAFFEALRGAAGRRVLIVDTCHAKNIEGRFEAHSLMKRSASSQFALIVAAKGDEESQEYAPAKHGLFTYSMLTALQGDSDADKDGSVSLGEIFQASLPVVEKLRHKQAGPQTPQMVAPPILANMPVTLMPPSH